MKKVAYFMGVDWKLIKQRPHFISEQLSSYYTLDLFFIQATKRWSKALIGNSFITTFNNFIGIKKIPFSSNNKILKGFEYILNIRMLKYLYSKEYDYIIITSPEILQYIDITKIKSKSIIYDCLDDFLEFPVIKNNRYDLIIELEKKLLKYSDIVTVSSYNLKNIIRKRGFERDIFVLYNAIDYKVTSKINLYTHVDSSNKSKNKIFNITYIGMISEWFDFETIIGILDIHKDVTFTVIGPSDIPLPSHNRIHYVGAVKHEELNYYASSADAFIMPFRLNNLIMSVDPIKVYEYISFYKPSFIIRYPETEKFEDFVCLYTNFEDLSCKIDAFKNDWFLGRLNVDKEKVTRFIEDNNWERRANELHEILENLNRLKS